jgi:hypothetical protein
MDQPTIYSKTVREKVKGVWRLACRPRKPQPLLALLITFAPPITNHLSLITFPLSPPFPHPHAQPAAID